MEIDQKTGTDPRYL